MFLLNPGNKAQIDQNPDTTTIDMTIDTIILIGKLKRATRIPPPIRSIGW
jgi:hypothetical protein